MKTSFRKYILAAALTASAGTMMAQELNSAYFTDDFKYRHDMNAAYGNEQTYIAIPILGNLNVKLQGSFGVGDVLFKNPYYGNPKYPNAKKTATFMHPGISADEALKGLDKDGNDLIFDIDIPIVSVGFKSWGGYNTIEIMERTHLGMQLPYEFFDFAKNMTNKEYSFDDLGLRGWSYAEIAFGHSRQIMDNLRVGAKVKILLGAAYADFSMNGVSAKMVGDTWLIQGKARGELMMEGAKFKQVKEEYKTHPGQYFNRVDGVDYDNAGIGGFGLGLDLGAVYEFKDMDLDWLNGAKVSLALKDLGFISWSNTMVAESSGDPFEFTGFKMRYENGSFESGGDQISDDLKDFANLQDKGTESGKTKALAATMRLGVEYPLPVYDKVKFGLLGTHRFDGIYSWTEGRLSANYEPLKWLNGGLNMAVTSYCTTMGWVLNIHPNAMNIFLGMDHMIGKTGKSMVPLDSNVSFNFGMNVAF
jgi:hypothetical protein